MAAGFTLAAFAIRFVLHPYLAPYAPFQSFFVACLLAEYLFGLGPALFSLALSFLLGTYYFIMPYGVFDGLISRSDAISVLNFVFITLFTIGLIEYLQRTLYSRQLLLKVSQSHHKISLYRENDRLHLAKKAATAGRPFEKLFAEFDQVLLFMTGGKAYPQPLFYTLSGMPDHAKEDWGTLFDGEARDQLQHELAQLEAGMAHQRQFATTIRNARGETRHAELSLERIVVGHETVTVLKLLEPSSTGARSQFAVGMQS
jgi:hypothetical protein